MAPEFCCVTGARGVNKFPEGGKQGGIPCIPGGTLHNSGQTVAQWFHTVVGLTCFPTLACALVACRAYTCQLNIVTTGFGTRYCEVYLVSAL